MVFFFFQGKPAGARSGVGAKEVRCPAGSPGRGVRSCGGSLRLLAEGRAARGGLRIIKAVTTPTDKKKERKKREGWRPPLKKKLYICVRQIIRLRFNDTENAPCPAKGGGA